MKIKELDYGLLEVKFENEQEERSLVHFMEMNEMFGEGGSFVEMHKDNGTGFEMFCGIVVKKRVWEVEFEEYEEE